MIPPGPYTLRDVTLKWLTTYAYDVPGFQVTGGPEWVDTDRWDFQLETEPILMPNPQFRKVLLSSLEDRFRLRAHGETRTAPVYELTVMGTGPNRHEVIGLVSMGSVIEDKSGSIQLRNSSLAEFAKLLSAHLGRPVLDKTGTQDWFRISLDWATVPGEDGGPQAAGLPPGTVMPAPRSDGSPILVAIEKQLGLRLTPTQAPVETIVIDGAKRP
jgi:uncharacterized protein (TIGR03435 family)